MADISMCSGAGCDKKEQCYRHTAPVNTYRQSYFCAPPVKINTDGKRHCDYFWSNEWRK
jgi:hypothetical protein